jgi:hypothetical protein
MPARLPRIVYLVHQSSGRARFRLSWLHDDPRASDSIADALLTLPGVREVQLRPYTGSVLCLFDDAQIDVAQLGEALCAHTGVQHVSLPGHESAEDVKSMVQLSIDEGSDLTKAIVDCFTGLHVDFLLATGGRISLPSFLSLVMCATAGIEVAAEGQLRLPEWHQLLWWGFRSFSTLEKRAIAQHHDPLAMVVGEAEPT